VTRLAQRAPFIVLDRHLSARKQLFRISYNKLGLAGKIRLSGVELRMSRTGISDKTVPL
jgi:hypothetical protein